MHKARVMSRVLFSLSLPPQALSSLHTQSCVSAPPALDAYRAQDSSQPLTQTPPAPTLRGRRDETGRCGPERGRQASSLSQRETTHDAGRAPATPEAPRNEPETSSKRACTAPAPPDECLAAFATTDAVDGTPVNSLVARCHSNTGQGSSKASVSLGREEVGRGRWNHPPCSPQAPYMVSLRSHAHAVSPTRQPRTLQHAGDEKEESGSHIRLMRCLPSSPSCAPKPWPWRSCVQPCAAHA